MRKILFIALILMLGLTACKENETEKDNSVVENSGDKVNDDMENNEEENGNGGIVVEEGEEEESESGTEEEEEQVGETQQEEPEVIKAELLMETEERWDYIENGELKKIEYTSVSTGIQYDGTEYPITFEYFFVYGELFITGSYTEGYNYYVSMISDLEDKVMITVDINEDRLHYIFEFNTGTMTRICTEDFWADKYIETVSIASDGVTMLVETEDEIYYCNGSDIRAVGTLAKEECPEANYIYAVFVQDKALIFCEIHPQDNYGAVKTSCYVYNPRTGGLLCTRDKLAVAKWSSLRYEFYYGMNKEGYFQITNTVTGRTSVTTIKHVSSSLECRAAGKTYILVPVSASLIQAVNLHTGKIICSIDLGIKLDSWDQWYVCHSDEGIYLKVNDEQYEDKQVWKIFKVEIEE